MYYLGADCGGTKSLYIIADENLKEVARYTSGYCTFADCGEDGIRERVTAGVTEVCRLAGIKPEELTWSALGFPGYGEQEGSEEATFRACSAIIPADRLTVCCDCVLGWAGALALQPGVNIVAGTGSICYGENAEGKAVRVGGWGGMCDEGSGKWFGYELIRLFTRQSDGRLPRTALYEAFRSYFHITEDLYWADYLTYRIVREDSELGKMQMLALELYRQGDPYAMELYEKAGRILAEMAETAARQLNLPAGSLVTCTGGVFKGGDPIMKPFCRAIAHTGLTLAEKQYPPETGALLLAIRDAKRAGL